MGILHYAYLVISVVLLAVTVQRLRGRSGPAPAATSLTSPIAAGALAGGLPGAHYACLAGLRARGLIDAVGLTGAPEPAGLTALEKAVLAACRRMDTAATVYDPEVMRQYDVVRDNLVRQGLLSGPAERDAARTRALTLFGWGFGGAAFILVPETPFWMFAVALVCVVAGFFALRVPEQTPGGRAVLNDLRRSNRHLHPASAPSWTVYGYSGAAMSAALFGAAAIWAADHEFADELGLPSAKAAGYNSGMYSGGGCGGSSGSACGSGSSSCSGGSGSSCGGGGGGGCGGGGG
ncbi:TIGR04222 domain-containing membrane protein [Longispora albida]|uniref:TIGR04222 domain-containing membrane protein n=1 Tax=Longispora albida TaxID=203523 RepID=UPI000372F6C8|nr:TIGR04222 domain-containing membrane protein [Longispora albida]